jgi:hypothetical protein
MLQYQLFVSTNSTAENKKTITKGESMELGSVCYEFTGKSIFLF